MMTLEQIDNRSHEAAKRAAQTKKVPFMIYAGDLQSMPPFPFPFIGTYRPPEYELIETYFVDSSGFGAPGEPALTVDQFKARIKVGKAYAILEVGEFQVYIGEFTRIW